MKYFTYPQCNNEFVRATKKDYKLYPNNNLIKSKYISLIGDTYTAIENIEEVLNDLTELEKLKEIIGKEDTSFANVILGTSNYGKNNSYYRAYLSIDGKNVIEIRIANHYETKRTALGKSNNLSQFIYQVVLITDPPKVKQSDSIVTTTSVANLKILTKGIISKDSSIEELSSMLKSIHDYLISPNSEWENNSTQQINCNTNMNKNKIRLTESQLHNMIRESVKQVLSELDWKTYASAADKARDRRLNNKDDYDAYRNTEREDAFNDAASKALSKKYNLRDVETYGDKDNPKKRIVKRFGSTSFTSDRDGVDFNDGKLYTFGERSKHGYAFPRPKSWIDYVMDLPYWRNRSDEERRDRYRDNEMNYDIDAFNHGRYEYVKGKGWQRKY